MADKRKRTRIKDRILSWRSARSKGRMAGRAWSWVAMLKAAAVIGLLVGAGFFLRYAEGFVKAASADAEGSLILV
ncbi:MAG: hypothetical protein JW955_21580, partial [Sedimentisphaerales bacterium]|nr:hypothetical protein [Sedimentisphaerales bacterium]